MNKILTKEQEYKKEYYEKNKERLKEKSRLYGQTESGKAKIKERTKNKQLSLTEKDRELRRQKDRENRVKNKEKIYDSRKKYRENNKELIRENKKKYCSNKRKTDPLFKLKENTRTLIKNNLINKSHNKKGTKTNEILGCSFEEFKKYLESKFEHWMSWNNYGKFNGEFNFGWDLDHIIPMVNASTKEEIIKLNHFTNFQPLCSKVNRHIKNSHL